MPYQTRFALPRFRILASSIPLIVIAVLARHQVLPGNRSCIAIGETMMQVAGGPFGGSAPADIRVAFTEDPARATVHVRIVETPETADFSVADDTDDVAATTCHATAATRYVGIVPAPIPDGPLILLTATGEADYRIFVRSSRVSPREAAALIVGAQSRHPHLATASL